MIVGKEGLLGLLLIWMDLRVDGLESFDLFIEDVITTFQLKSPTIVYNGDEEAPEICYTFQWVLCLPVYNESSSPMSPVPTPTTTKGK